MAPQPQRREHRKTHLDASVVPVKQALLRRAVVLDATSGQVPAGHPDERCAEVYAYMAAEFRALAEELHYW